tara:strand:- start:1832 stop:2617 length:786 start_codon:yes stop_codon:yes gene_type:complete
MLLEKEILNHILLNLKSKIDKENRKVSPNTYYKFTKKNKTSLTTKHDVKIEKIIRNEIAKSYPTHEILGEELKNVKKNSKYKWVIDPIDGTKSMLAGMPTWSNLIGFSINSKAKIGFANFPSLNKYYFSDGKNSFVVHKNKRKKIFSKKNKNFENSLLVTNSFHAIKNIKILKFFKQYPFLFKITGIDSYNYCLLAEGKIDIILEADLKPYDILPLIPIIKNSGGLITNWSGGSDISKGRVIVASNKTLHKKFLLKFKKFT